MAEYYPLLAKAVAALPNSTSETRRNVYDRARKALLGQLQNLQPAVPEADILRETQALDAAVQRLEAELAAKELMLAAPSKATLSDAVSAAPAQKPVERQTARPAPAVFDRSDTQLKPPPRIFQPPRAPNAARLSTGAAANGAVAPSNNVPPSAIGAAQVADAQPLQTMSAGRSEAMVAELPMAAPKPRLDGVRSDVPRPYAPQPIPDDEPQRRRLWIVVGIVVILVAMVAAAAWKLRDRPEDLVAFKSIAHGHADESHGKIAARVGGIAAPQETPAPKPDQQLTQSQPALAQTAAPVAAAQRPADADASIPVAYRAALLVEAPDEPNKLKTYVGTVIWRLDNVSSDVGQPLTTAVRADIDIPDDKLKVRMDLQKNTDASLSASHTITIVFTIAPDSPTGGIKQISVPQLRQEDNPNGEPLKGILVPIMENSFLVGLSRGDAEAANMDMIKNREWFDIPILLDNGRVAKLTFEKNASGNRAINEALASWRG